MRTWSTLKKLIWLKKGIMKAASWVWKTVTGSILHITDALAGDVSALSVAINPVQSGSGDPSPDNVRPISGWTQAKITRTGKNLFDNAHAPYYGRYISYTSPTSAEWRTSGDSASYCIPVKPNTKYAIKPHATTAVFRVCAISTDPATIGSATVQSVNAYSQNASGNFYCTITTGPNERWLVIQCGKSVTEGRTGMVMVELGNGYSEYEDYQGVSVTIDLDGTVYGGTLDVLTGVLTARPYYASYNGETLVGPWVSSMDKYVAGSTPTTGAQVVDLGGTPTTVQLDPAQLSTLLGENYIWADTGNTTMTYMAQEA